MPKSKLSAKALTEIKARFAAAPVGPYKTAYPDDPHAFFVANSWGYVAVLLDAVQRDIALSPAMLDEIEARVSATPRGPWGTVRVGNPFCEFIAAARTDVPALLEEVRYRHAS